MTRRPIALATLAALFLSAATFADAPTTRPAPLRTVTVNGEARSSFQTASGDDLKRADLSSYEAALADAKDRATRAAKVLAVTLGPPVTVETLSAITEEHGANDRRSDFVSNVKIVYELREP